MALQQVSLLQDFVSLIFPNTCLGCHDTLPRGLTFICPACQVALPKTRNHEVEVPAFEQKFSGLIDFDKVLVYLHFQKHGIVQRLMHELKYNHRPELSLLLGRWYGATLKSAGYEEAFDCVIPVPLHKSKLRSRGYNQSEGFAQGLSEAFNIPCHPHALIRTRANETQTRKSRLERWQNVNALFELTDESLVAGCRVLLVDDVLTTGSTLLSCAEALSKSAMASVSFGLLAAAK